MEHIYRIGGVGKNMASMMNAAEKFFLIINGEITGGMTGGTHL